MSDPSSRVRCPRGSGQRAAPSFVGALLPQLGAALLAVGCAPNPSTVPLGLGPLAVAEQARDAEATATRRQKSAAGAAASRTPSASSSAPKAPLPAAESEEDAGGDDETAGTEPSDPSGPAFEGTYAGEDVAIYRLTGFPEREERDDKAKIRIEKASGGNLGITLINSADGSDLCELIARVEGKTALLESTQPCFSDGSEGSLEAELTSGRVVLDGDRLKMDAEGTLSVSLPDQDLDGQLTYSFEGKRE